MKIVFSLLDLCSITLLLAPISFPYQKRPKNAFPLTIRGRGQILREGVKIFAPGRGVVKNSRGRGMELFLQGGGRVGGNYKKWHKFFKRDKRDR